MKSALVILLLVFRCAAQITLSGNASVRGNAALSFASPVTPPPPDITAPGIYSVATNFGSGLVTVDTAVDFGSGANRGCAVFISWGMADASPITQNIVSNSTSFTYQSSVTFTGQHDDESYGQAAYYFHNPPTGNHHVRVSFDGSTYSHHICIFALTNTAQTLAVRESVSRYSDESEDDKGATVDSSSTDLVLDSIFYEPGQLSGGPTAGAGQTLRIQTTETVFSKASASSKAGANFTQTTTWATTGGGRAALSVLSIKGAR